MAKLNNPFVIGTYAGEHYFCDRVDESKELISNILNGRNTVLVSHRRLGKTGLIRHCFEQPEIKRTITFSLSTSSQQALWKSLF